MNFLELSPPTAGIRRRLLTMLAVVVLPISAIAWQGMPFELTVVLASLAAGALLAWQAARELTGLITRLRQEVAQLAQSGYARRVPVAGPVEIRALARDFNAMATMIEDSRRQLELSERRFRELTELSSDWYWESDAEHRFTFISPGAERFFGGQVEEMIGRRRWEIDYVGFGEQEWAPHRADLDRRKAFEDLRLARRLSSGGISHFSISGRPVYDAKGLFRGYRGVGHDVSAETQVQHALRSESELLSRVIETMAEGVVIFDADGRYLRINAVAERILGVSRRQLERRTLREIPVRREPFGVAGGDLRDCVFWRLREGEARDTRRVFHLVRPDQTRVLVSRNATRLEDSAGKFEGAVATFEDITERVRSEERSRMFLATTRDGFWVVDRDGRIEEANDAMCRLLGMEARELIGKRTCEVLDGLDETTMLRRIERVVSERQLRFEIEHRARDGKPRVLEVNANYVNADGGRIYSFVHDVTDRKRQESQLVNIARGVSGELGEAFFRSLVEHLARDLGADYVFAGEVVGDAGDKLRTLAFMGDGAFLPTFEYRLKGTPCANAIRQRGTVTYPSRVAELFPEDADLRKLGVEGYVGTALTGADGQALGILVVMSRKPIEQAQVWGSMLRIFGARAGAEIERARAEATVRRVNESLEHTVRERTAQLEQANRELESFNYSISHDLRNPLSAISGFAELLREQSAGVEDVAREIEVNARRMEEMIEALLRLSHTARGELRDEFVDIRRMAEEVVRDLSRDGDEIVIGDLPGTRGDPELLRQVFSNLIGNALKYSSRHPAPRVEISAHRRDGMIEVAVRDNGIGFDVSDAGRLFEPFRRLPSAAGYSGSGIGLAIVQAIVRRHGGGVSAASAPGQGAVFRFTLPDRGGQRVGTAIIAEQPVEEEFA